MRQNWIEQGKKGSGRWTLFTSLTEWHIEPATGGFLVHRTSLHGLQQGALVDEKGVARSFRTAAEAKEAVEVHLADAKTMDGHLGGLAR